MSREIKIEGKNANGNANGRIYPEAILKREVERYQEKIREGRALGELNHPSESTNELTGDQTYRHIPVGERCNGIEIVKPQTDLNGYKDESDIFEVKRPGSVLKEYQKEMVKKDMESKYSNAILTPEEENELKEKLFGQDKKVPYVAPECTCATDLTPTKEANLTFEEIANELIRLHKRKNNDYGDAAHESFKEFGLISYIIRLNDKLSRLKSLTKPDTKQMVGDESIIDTLKDLAAYAIMAIESLSR